MPDIDSVDDAPYDIDSLVEELAPAKPPSGEEVEELPPPPPEPAVEPPEVVPPAPPIPPPPEPPREDPRVAEGLASLMRESRELQELRRKLEEERAQLEPLRRYEQLHQMLEDQDAEGALAALGLDLDEVNRARIEGRGVRPLGRLQKQMEAKLEEMDRLQRERLARIEQVEQARTQQEVMADIRANMAPEQYPLSAAVLDLSGPAVLQKAQEHFKRDGKVPSYDQVIGEVESELGSFLDRLMRSEAVRKRYLREEAEQDLANTPSPTLTNGAAAAVSKRKSPNTNQDDELPEDREEAIEAILRSMKA